MNRANFGNVITNGMQIGSVGATTLSHIISRGHAEQALNNKNVEPELTPEEQERQRKQKFISDTNLDYNYNQALLKSKGLYSDKQAMSDEQLKLEQQANIDRKVDKAEKRLAKGEDAKQHMTPEEASSYEQYRADKALNEMNKYYEGEENSDEPSIDQIMTAKSEQNVYSKTKVKNDYEIRKELLAKKGIGIREQYYWLDSGKVAGKKNAENALNTKEDK